MYGNSGWPWHRENREFGCSFSRQGKYREFAKKTLKISFHTGNLPPRHGAILKLYKGCGEM